MTRLTSPSRIDPDAAESEAGFEWGWFMVLGAALIVLSALAFRNRPPADTVAVHAVGLVMVIGALAQLGTTLLVPRGRGVGLLVLSAVLYGAAGVCALVDPKLAATPLTVLLALASICSGIVRVRLTSVMPTWPGWGWMAASGHLTVLSGLLFTNTVWRLGMALAVDLTFQVATLTALGVALGVTPPGGSPSTMGL